MTWMRPVVVVSLAPGADTTLVLVSCAGEVLSRPASVRRG